jgi:glycosyltransferase involved in cell wall biosynthesis
MAACHHVVVPSQSIKDLLTEHYGDAIATHLSIVPTGVETTKFSRVDHAEARAKLGWTEDFKVLISVGRLAKEKSFDLLLKAFARLQRADTILVILGGGEERKQLESLAAELKIQDRVRFTGLVPFDEVPTYLAAADLFVFASVTETQGLVTLEAMASGLPVVAVDGSGTRDAVSSSCSILTEPNDTALAAGIAEMLGRNDLDAVREAAKRRAREFDVLVQGEALVEVYRKAVAAHRARSRVLIMPERIKTRWEELLSIFRL